MRIRMRVRTMKARVYDRLGSAYAESNEMNESVGWFGKVCELNGCDALHASACTNRGIIYCKQKEFSAACTEFDRAVEIFQSLTLTAGSTHPTGSGPTDPHAPVPVPAPAPAALARACFNRSVVYRYLGLFSLELTDLKRAVSVSSESDLELQSIWRDRIQSLESTATDQMIAHAIRSESAIRQLHTKLEASERAADSKAPPPAAKEETATASSGAGAKPDLIRAAPTHHTGGMSVLNE